MRAGVQAGSNVITTSTEPMPGTSVAAFSTPSLIKRIAGHPGVVAVMIIRTAPSIDGDVVDEAEIDDVVTELGIDHNAQGVPDTVDQFIGHDGALTVSS